MTVLIPAYEPDERMITLVQELIDLRERPDGRDYHLLIVDDGSGESYAPLFEAARTMGCTVLHQPANRGKGAALKLGFAYLIEHGEPDGVVCADCDGQHRVTDIIAVADGAMSHPDTMVLGRRGFKMRRRLPDGTEVSEPIPRRSLIGNTVTRHVFYLSAGVKVYDANTGLRAYAAGMLPYLCKVRGDRFEYEMNLLTDCRRDGYALIEIPIETVYDTANHTSHFRTVRDTLRVCGSLLRFGTSSVLAFLIDFAIWWLIIKLLGRWAPELSDALRLGAAVVAARVISSHSNYWINKTFVFGGRTRNSYVKYILLVAVILSLNYLLQLLWVVLLHMPDVAGKLITETLLFAGSFILQRTVVFRYQTNNKGGPRKA